MKTWSRLASDDGDFDGQDGLIVGEGLAGGVGDGQTTAAGGIVHANGDVVCARRSVIGDGEGEFVHDNLAGGPTGRGGGAPGRIVIQLAVGSLIRADEVNEDGVGYIGGAVARPGSYPIRGQITLDRALILASGTTPQADLSSVTIVRQREAGPETLTYDATRDGGAGCVVRPGDSIHVPAGFTQFVKLMGEIRNPGRVPYREGMTVTDAIIAANDFSEYAAKNRVEVRRGQGEHIRVFKVRVKDILGGKIDDFLLMPGDVINVPLSPF